MSDLVFHTHPQSRGRIAHWTMEVLGQPYRTVWLGVGPEMKSLAYKAIHPMDKVPALETALQPGPHICGEQFTAADVYVGASLAWGLMLGTIEKRSVFVDCVARVKARPASQRADAINEARIQAQAAG